MPQYMLQVSYSREGWQALIAQPQNRVEAVKQAVEKLAARW